MAVHCQVAADKRHCGGHSAVKRSRYSSSATAESFTVLLQYITCLRGRTRVYTDTIEDAKQISDAMFYCCINAAHTWLRRGEAIVTAVDIQLALAVATAEV
eukprot:15649-Heterococcus_DN1.PRE.1